MRKKILSLVTVLFFGLMLFGTLFHQRIDSVFREHVTVVTPRPYKENVEAVREIDGEKRSIITTENYLLLPKEAVQNNMVYVLETVEEEYGSYDVVRLKVVEAVGETADGIKIKRGVKATDRVAAVFCEGIADGERVVAEE